MATMVHDQDLSTAREASRALIDARLVEAAKFDHLKSTVRALAQQGASVDALSEATGLPPQHVREILTRS